MELKDINEIDKENLRLLNALYFGNHLNKNEIERVKRLILIMELELKRRVN